MQDETEFVSHVPNCILLPKTTIIVFDCHWLMIDSDSSDALLMGATLFLTIRIHKCADVQQRANDAANWRRSRFHQRPVCRGRWQTPSCPGQCGCRRSRGAGRNLFICACFVTMLASSESSTSLPAATMAAQMHSSLNEADLMSWWCCCADEARV